MNIAIIGGRALAFHLIEQFRRNSGDIVVINKDRDFCEHLSNNYDVDVVCGDGTKLHVLEEAEIDDFDTCIALTDNDADNLAICQMCGYFFNISNLVCTVSDPCNADVFRRLGIDEVIGGASLLARAVGNAVTGNSGVFRRTDW